MQIVRRKSSSVGLLPAVTLYLWVWRATVRGRVISISMFAVKACASEKKTFLKPSFAISNNLGSTWVCTSNVNLFRLEWMESVSQRQWLQQIRQRQPWRTENESQIILQFVLIFLQILNFYPFYFFFLYELRGGGDRPNAFSLKPPVGYTRYSSTTCTNFG